MHCPPLPSELLSLVSLSQSDRARTLQSYPDVCVGSVPAK